jgi:3-(3-hydroxy-phenyl)propionate hydroxylase
VLDDEALRILQAIGMGEQLGELTAPLEQARYINGSGHLLLDIPLKDTAAVSGHPFVNAFYQPELEGVLRTKLARFPSVTLRTGQEVERIAQDADAVHLTVRDLASDHKMIVHTRYALGCDGARSFTRKALDIALQDFHQDAAWLVLDTEI